MYLDDFSEFARWCREDGGGLTAFLDSELVHMLGWPKDVSEQFLYDHSGHGAFQEDYGDLDLSHVLWGVEVHSAAEIASLPTGPSEADCIDRCARNHQFEIDKRDSSGFHPGVAEMWEVHGTWRRWPLLLDRDLVEAGRDGLQVVEGRTRIGVLKGRLGSGEFVAPRHLVWVGRRRSAT